jgi:hypothetical protein
MLNATAGGRGLDDDDDDDDDLSAQEEEEGATTTTTPSTTRHPQATAFHSFAPKAQGVLFKISPLSEKASDDIETYIRKGAMERDLIYVDTLYGIIAPSQSREYSMFWESPWVEEQIKETGKKRKIEQQQRTMAVRSFIKASTTAAAATQGSAMIQDTEDVDRFLSTVDRLTQWDRHTHRPDDTVRESVKTVSRMVQSFEKKAAMSLLTLLQSGGIRNPGALHHLQRLSTTADPASASGGDVGPITHSLRRSPHTYVAFASLVAAELVLSEANSGSKNISINTSRRMDQERFHAINTMLDVLARATPTTLPRDSLGLPLMQTNAHICVSKGVLVVANQNSTQATYILEINDLDDILARRPKRANKGLDVLQITAQIFEEADATTTSASASALSPDTNAIIRQPATTNPTRPKPKATTLAALV